MRTSSLLASMLAWFFPWTELHAWSIFHLLCMYNVREGATRVISIEPSHLERESEICRRVVSGCQRRMPWSQQW